MNEYNFETSKIISSLSTFTQKGITEFTVHDKSIARNKKAILELFAAVQKNCPQVFITVPVEANIIDRQLIQAAQEINVSLEIPVTGTVKGSALLFDKKLYSSKAALLNQAELVFGFNMEYGIQTGDTYKLFRDRLDFAVSLYPNHIDFEQLSSVPQTDGASAQTAGASPQTADVSAKPTGIYSSKDLDYSRDIAFACSTFYTNGRAVPWFNTILKPLKITPSAFFADFAEWQRCSSCSIEKGFNPEEASHKELEKMQLVFLEQKYEEKHKENLFLAVQDLVKLNGAFSRLVSDGLEEIIETTYSPDDLLSPQSYDLVRFCDNACYEDCTVKIFQNDDFPDYKILDR